ncbi:MAG TPA: hypothetical protein VIY51_24360 [Xanthobacteraceae bacterium]
MAERTPVFEMHIRPLFRLLDRQHMLRVRSDLDLWNYDAVKSFATVIGRKIGQPNPSMPTADAGGAWPSEWVALFNRWAQGGFRRLAPAAGRDYKLVKAADGRCTLSCKVDIPDTDQGDSVAWLDVVSAGPPTASYQLLVYPGEVVPPAAQTIEVTCLERVDPASAAAGVTVVDANGTHIVNLEPLVA